MKNYDKSVAISHNPNRIYIPDYPYRLLITGGPRSGKTKVLLNLIKHQLGISYKYQLLMNEREKVGIQKLKYPKALINYLQTIDDVNENLEDQIPTKKIKKSVVFNNMIPYMEANKN